MTLVGCRGNWEITSKRRGTSDVTGSSTLPLRRRIGHEVQPSKALVLKPLVVLASEPDLQVSPIPTAVNLGTYLRYDLPWRVDHLR